MTIVYHEILKEGLDSAMKDGLKRNTRGDKGDYSAIKRADQLLDNCRPKELIQASLSRNDNLYCYLAHEDGVADITDGKIKHPTEISQSQKHQFLKIKVDPARCYASDLDLYDQILSLVKYEDLNKARNLAKTYWQRTTRLDKYNHDRGFKRPEIMVTYDIPGSQIEVVKS
jgi:hypothetical protein